MGKKIMIIDDEKELLEELRETLSLNGYDVVAVSDPNLVLDIAKRERPDIIILDLKMPGKTGFQIADEFKAISDFVHVPIIAMSAFLKDTYRPLLDICGIKECLKKPFNPEDLFVKIKALLEE